MAPQGARLEPHRVLAGRHGSHGARIHRLCCHNEVTMKPLWPSWVLLGLHGTYVGPFWVQTGVTETHGKNSGGFKTSQEGCPRKNTSTKTWEVGYSLITLVYRARDPLIFVLFCRPHPSLGGILEALGGILEALGGILEALGGVLEAMLRQDRFWTCVCIQNPCENQNFG